MRRVFQTSRGTVTVTMEPTDREDSAGRDGYNVNVTVDRKKLWAVPQELHVHISSKGIATDSKRAGDIVAATTLSFATADMEAIHVGKRLPEGLSNQAPGIDPSAIEYAALEAEEKL